MCEGIIVKWAAMLKPRHRVALDYLLPADSHESLSAGALDTGFDAFLEDFRRSAPLPMRLAFAAGLETCCWVAPLLIGRLGPISRLGREDGTRALEALGACRFYLLRQQLLLVKTVLTLHYGGLPEVYPA
jgi:hypothetical protein